MQTLISAAKAVSTLLHIEEKSQQAGCRAVEPTSYLGDVDFANHICWFVVKASLSSVWHDPSQQGIHFNFDISLMKYQIICDITYLPMSLSVG